MLPRLSPRLRSRVLQALPCLRDGVPPAAPRGAQAVPLASDLVAGWLPLLNQALIRFLPPGARSTVILAGLGPDAALACRREATLVLNADHPLLHRLAGRPQEQKTGLQLVTFALHQEACSKLPARRRHEMLLGGLLARR